MEFLYSTEALLNLLDVDTRIPVAHFAAGLLLVKIWLLLLLMGFVVYGRTKRRLSRRNNRERENAYRMLIFEYALSHSDNWHLEILNNLKPKLIAQEERGFFRRVLLSHLKTLAGDSRHRLACLYRDLGYMHEDIEEMSSWFWWDRLGGVIRLEALNLKELAPAFEVYMNDPHDLVAIASIRALSSLQVQGKTGMIIDTLSRRAPHRRDIFVEILINLGQAQSQEITHYLLECYDPYVACICISVLGELRASESLPVLTSFARSSSDEVVIEVCSALAKIKDPNSIPTLHTLMDHPTDIVRANALAALVKLGDQNLKTELFSYEDDTSVEVRRVAFDALKQGAA